MKTVIEMAREAGINLTPAQFSGVLEDEIDEFQLEHFAELVRADEREACAKVCETTPKIRAYGNNRALQDECAAAIRNRNNT